MRCARCEFTGDLAEHAPASGHWPCVCCNRSLAEHETQTCTRCVGKFRADLVEIGRNTGRLHDQALALRPSWRPSEGRGGGGHAIPGGDALVMLGPGSDGRAQTYAIIHGLDASHADDEWPEDVPSVLFELSRWEDDWRRTFGHGAAGAASLASCAGYLSEQAGLAGRTHPAFDEAAADISRLAGALRTAVSASDAPEPAGADCLTCGVELVREVTDEGLSDERVCRRCRRAYSFAEYLFALRAKAGATDALVTVGQFAEIAGVRVGTVRVWVHRHRLVACVGRQGPRYRWRDLDAARQHKTERREAS